MVGCGARRALPHVVARARSAAISRIESPNFGEHFGKFRLAHNLRLPNVGDKDADSSLRWSSCFRVVKQAAAAKDSAASGVQALIDKAKALVGEGKYEDASRSLQQLAGQTLTVEQQKLVDGLKEQIQKALASRATGEAATSVGNLLKK